MKGKIFNIQHFTIHDGPGIRTEIFFKGCPLSCKWCGNPESQSSSIMPGVFSSRCLGEAVCDGCQRVCRNQAILFGEEKIHSIDYSRCKKCLQCVDECPSEAIKTWGEMYSIDECLQEILSDRGYYEKSKGGVTVSGGEPLMQADFVAELFKKCRDERINTCIETTFFASKQEIDKVIPVTDIVITDIKCMDSNIHKQYTGVDNTLILENIKSIAKIVPKLIIRIPVIPSVNDDMENAKRTADYINNELQGRVDSLQLLSFMRLGEEKYRSIGRSYPMEYLEFDRDLFQKRVEEIKDYFMSQGINAIVGTSTKQ